MDQLQQSEPKKKKTKKTKESIVVNVSDSQYPVIRYVAKKMLNWKVQNEPEGTNWDMWWTDAAVYSDFLGKMQPYQKVNHFPGMYSLARKNHLGRNLMRMHKEFPQQYNYFPYTWLLPAELGDFRAHMGKQRTFILKPEASCQGKGIMLVKDTENISINEHYVAQRYLCKPYLVDGLKFDLRIYVLVAGCDPLRIYIYKEGLARFATEPYIKPSRDNLDNICMHLTNYAVNKDSDKFIFNNNAAQMDQGHKRSMTSIFEHLREKGEDVEKLWTTIKKMMNKTLCSVQPILAHQYKSCQGTNYINNMCFEILGMDVMLDHKLKPFLLEVNHSPSFTTDTPLDAQIKRHLIAESLELMNISIKTKQQIIQEGKASLQQRVITGKSVRLTMEEKQQLINQGQAVRDQYENAHLGNFEKIYPMEVPDDDYQRYIIHAAKLYEESTGANIRRQPKQSLQQTMQQEKPREKVQSEKTLPSTHKKSTAVPMLKKDITIAQLPFIDPEEVMTTKSQRYRSLKPAQRSLLKNSNSQMKRSKLQSQGSFLIPKIFMINPS